MNRSEEPSRAAARETGPSTFKTGVAENPVSNGVEPKPARPTRGPAFAITGAGLTNRQVWATVQADLARHGELTAGEIETWMQPAAIVGVEGEVVVIAAPTTVNRDRLVRFTGAIESSLAGIIGTSVAVRFVTEDAWAEAAPGIALARSDAA